VYRVEILVGLWLRALKPRRCREVVRSWRLGLSTPHTCDNDNLPSQMLEDREYVSDLIDRHCGACPRKCSMKALVPTRARKSAPVRSAVCAPL
jgi:hypothetical protein